jgi:hypothetical protein
MRVLGGIFRYADPEGRPLLHALEDVVDAWNADHLTKEVHDLLRTRETAEVAVNDNAVEAVVDEGEQSLPRRRPGSPNS